METQQIGRRVAIHGLPAALPAFVLAFALIPAVAGGQVGSGAPGPAAESPIRSLSVPAKPGAMGPNLAATSAGVTLTWLEPLENVANVDKGYAVRASTLRGDAFQAPETLASGADLFANWADFPSLVESTNGQLFAHWSTRGGAKGATDVVLSRKSEGGKWEILGAPHDDGTATEHGFVSFVKEGEGLRVFWLDGRETTKKDGAMALRSARVGDRIEAGEVLDARVCDCCQTAAALTSEGPVVVYRDRGDDETRDISIMRRVEGVWTKPAPVAQDRWVLNGCPVNGPAIAARDRRVAVAWFTGAAGFPKLRLAYSDDAGAHFANPVDLDDKMPFGRVDIALDDAGDAIVSWLANGDSLGRPGRAAVRLSRVSRDGRIGQPVTVGWTGSERASGFPRLIREGKDLVSAWLEFDAKAGVSKLRAARVPLSMLAEVPKPATPLATPAPARAWDGKRGSPMPPYEATGLDGRKTNLKSLVGKPLLVNLWATWCLPCRKEMPELSELSRRYDGRLRVLGISVDQNTPASKVEAFVKREKIPYQILHDPEDRASSVFGVPALPGSFLFDSKGVLVWSRIGLLEKDDRELAEALKGVVEGPK